MADRTYRCPLCGTSFIVPPEMQEPVLCGDLRHAARQGITAGLVRMELVSDA
jgi:hypothetical protein